MDFRSSIWIFILLNLVLTTHFTNGDEGGGGPNETEEWNVINGTVKRNYTLTGIPQIDYVHDPNLPRELNGYNLSTYPFFNKVPKNINFSCDGLKDGFYASVEHGCQLYHHCLFGTRYDFLCANYTAFDQRTFICQFVSEVDCPNSALFFHRNDALYKAVSTTTPAPVIIYVGPNGRRIRPSVSLPPPIEVEETSQKLAEEEPNSKDEDFRDYPTPPVRDRAFPRRRNRRRCGPGRRRRCRRPRPRPDYYDYYDYEDYYDSDRRNKPKVRNREYDYEDYDSDAGVDDLEKGSHASEKINPTPKKRNKFKEYEFESRLGSSTRSPSSKAKAVPMSPPAVATVAPTAEVPLEPLSVAANREKIFSKSRAPPKIRPPVPVREKGKYGSLQGRYEDLVTSTTSTTTSTTTKAPPTRAPRTQPPPATNASPQPEYEEYYDEEAPATTYRNNIFGYLPTPVPPTNFRSTVTTTAAVPTTTAPPPSTMPVMDQMYEYEYEDYEEEVTTTLKPEPITVPTSTVRNSPRRFPTSQRQESSQVVEDRRRAPGIEHQKINEALEAPSRASLRIPYHNKPRPSFLKNAHMLFPVTTSKTITSTASTVSPFETFDGVNKRFPIFDTDTRLPLETVSAAAEQQRQRLRNVETTSENVPEEYMGFEEIEPEEVTERYGKQYSGSSDTYNAELTSRRSSTYSEGKQYAPPVDPSPAKFMPYQPPSYQPQSQAQIQPQQTQVQRSRTLTFDLPRGNNPSMGSQPSPISNHRPEYISLLSDDEETQGRYYAPPAPSPRSLSRSRFTGVGSRGRMTSAQEMYPSYLPAPPSYFNPLLDKYVNPKSLEGLRRRRRQEIYPEPFYRGQRSNQQYFIVRG